MIRIGGDDFENRVINAASPVLVEFYSDSCVACKKLSPALSQLEEEYGGRLDFYKVNAAYDAELAEKYGVRSAPTVLLFARGEVKKQAQGALKKDALEAIIKEALA